MSRSGSGNCPYPIAPHRQHPNPVAGLPHRRDARVDPLPCGHHRTFVGSPPTPPPLAVPGAASMPSALIPFARLPPLRCHPRRPPHAPLPRTLRTPVRPPSFSSSPHHAGRCRRGHCAPRPLLCARPHPPARALRSGCALAARRSVRPCPSPLVLHPWPTYLRMLRPRAPIAPRRRASLVPLARRAPRHCPVSPAAPRLWPSSRRAQRRAPPLLRLPLRPHLAARRPSPPPLAGVVGAGAAPMASPS
nr:proline-rich receptor-like protein kinase PERK10 [Aegilops tauschii subsp. strangulata]